jgi:hypothetical protein
MTRLTVSGVRSTATFSKRQKLYRDFTALVRELADIDAQLEAGSLIDVATGEKLSDPSAAERSAAISALDAVNYFLNSERIHCRILYQLHIYLNELRFGITTAVLRPPKPRGGRKQDSAEVSTLKGGIAAIARLQMASGQSRDQAAAWVARKISSALASRLSSKPFIKAGAVKEWIDRYDCGAKILEMFTRDDERKAFESCFPVSTAADEDSTDRYLRQMEFLRDHVPENKRCNPMHGVRGFMIVLHSGALYLAEGYRPNFDHLFTDLERYAVDRVASDLSAPPNS